MVSLNSNGLFSLSTILALLITPLNSWNITIDVFLYQPNSGVVQNPCDRNFFLHGDTNNVVTWNMIPVDSFFKLLKTVKRRHADLTVAVHYPYSEAHTKLSDLHPIQSVPHGDCSGIIQGHCLVHSTQNVEETVSPPNVLTDCIHSRFHQAVTQAMKTQNGRTGFILMSSKHALLELSTLLVATNPMTTVMALEINGRGFLTRGGDLSTIYRTSTDHAVTVIIACSGSCIQNVVKQILDLQLKQKHGSSRNIRWLLANTDQTVDADVMVDVNNINSFEVVTIHLKPCVVQYSSQDIDDISRGIVSVTSKKNAIKTAYSALKERNRMKCRINSKFLKHACDTCGLNNVTLRLGIKQSPGFIVKTIINGTVHYTGMTINLIKQMAKALNFSYILLEPEDNEWGREINGSWTGVVGDLLSGRTDVIASPLAVTAERAAILDFTVPYFYDTSCIVIKTPDNDDTKWLILATKFQHLVLVCIFVSFVFSTIFFCVLEEVQPAHWPVRKSIGLWNRCSDTLLVHFASLMANGISGSLLPVSLSGRLVMGAWWIFSLLTAAVYRGDIIAFLTASRTTLPFNTLTEMVAQDAYSWGTLGGSAYETLFRNSSTLQYKQIWEGMESRLASDPSVLSVDLNVHLEKVNAGHYAFITNTLTLKNWKVKNCDLLMLSDTFYPLMFAMVLSQNSSVTNILSKEIYHLRENGVIEYWYNQETSNVSCIASIHDMKKIDIIALLSVFYAAVIGVSLALVALVGEILCSKFRRPVTSPQQPTTRKHIA
ncbi:probable glutamate receptor [Haliotis asinina]|uniref:probable glutamate receptor n=1 Tax=Haliotis asinina TaxID=109174 RepID=UPI003532207E